MGEFGQKSGLSQNGVAEVEGLDGERGENVGESGSRFTLGMGRGLPKRRTSMLCCTKRYALWRIRCSDWQRFLIAVA